MNIFNNLSRSAKFLGEMPAIEFEGRSIHYRSLYEQALTVAGHLKNLGLIAGDRVALLLPNCPEFIISYYACQALGACPVSLNVMNLRGDNLLLLQDSKARFVISHVDLLPNLPKPQEITSVQSIFLVGCEHGETFAFYQLLQSTQVLKRIKDQLASDPAAILYTSATTGKAKGVQLSQGNLTHNVFAACQSMDLKPGNRILCFLPLFHCFAQNHIVNACIRGGGTLVLHRRFDEQAVLNSAQEHQVDILFGVPTSFQRLLKAPGSAKDLSSLRYSFSAAAPMKEETAHQWRSTFSHVINEGYGLTETSPMAAYNHPFTYQPNSIGTPIDGVEMKVIDEEGQPSREGSPGEICIKGTNVMLGYYNQPEATRLAIHDGWFHTGDIAYRDDRDCFYLIDRKKNMINSAGFKIWPSSVEKRLLTHQSVQEICIIAAPHQDLGECVAAFIIFHSSKTQSTAQQLEALKYWCENNLPRYQIPKVYFPTRSLPRSPSGKILRHQLREQLQTKTHNTNSP